MKEQEQILQHLQNALKNPVGISHVSEISLRVQQAGYPIHVSVDDALQKVLINPENPFSKNNPADLPKFAEQIWSRLDHNPALLTIVLTILREVANYVGPTAQPKPILGEKPPSRYR